MKIVLFVAATVLLSGCTGWGGGLRDQEVGIRNKYVITQIPKELIETPGPMYKIDPKKATDKEMAKWMLDSEERYLKVERQLKAAKKYQEDKIKDLIETQKLKPEDIIRN